MEPVCVSDFEAYLKRALSEKWWEYFRSGCGSELTLRDNCSAFQRYRLRPRNLRDVSKRDTSTSILGHRLDFPVGVSPTACHGIICKDGEIATAKGAASVGSAMVLSMLSNKSLEDVASAVPRDALLFQQINFMWSKRTKERWTSMFEALVKRTERAGFKAFVMTIDQPTAKRSIDIIDPSAENSAENYVDVKYPNLVVPNEPVDLHKETDPTVTWKDVQWLVSKTRLPVIVKGILSAEEARNAVRSGVAGILVSNHGARQLDGVSATIDVLVEIVDAVRGSNVEVYLDGGIRTGTDVFKALALGARAVFIGRPALWGLAYNGAEGLKKVLNILREEFSIAMALMGCSTLSDIKPEMVVSRPFSRL